MPNLGLPELLVLLFIVVLLFGVGKLPQLGKGIGEGIRNFKQAVKDGGQDSDKKEPPTGNGSGNGPSAPK
ncbi:MAG TPA: twin-arginine translocase TatA/TatE family subunit [Thermoanaerobaculia bacterium]|nr:twin-arginine translocase TatA/TatE family subunit [Thermoanaerobaculia bacterium]HRY44006.1 twin-arginine translocase TatA/TatE family subunit [Thermoanaerobaculia bacterium]